ncbi:ABC transporter substrate-binding protein [Photobacterium sp. WH77]|uniref:ABC transporter substrate-binding protein n=1 Tax=Photobacterium TaxID=657 RepID=UPI001C46E717|nr:MULTISPECIES: ABC transporter substrate-binding protein [Photobacterium]MBV7260553.1 ABC transporter substrate-binding protein [Photobacterium sp. WH24]MCG2835672.1 ABC transporter substrate-binding protein [Photobacterium sp. WH77]MCG2843285.1 ABC transporter substrate-binding protein [Photobacterium sp. WH80]MDO6580844.1 ABC transporter substrate-binding protein [Photobacterium sp. 2_MG-2023]
MLYRLLILALLAISPLHASEKKQLVILTTFNPALLSSSIEIFEQQHAGLDVTILQRRESEGLALLALPDHGVNVVLSSSRRLFQPLADSHSLVPVAELTDEHSQLDSDYIAVLGYSGCGIIWNQRYIDRNALPVPSRWESLIAPVYHSHLVMSSPSRSATTHLMVESLLQRYSWDQGWRLLLQLGGNLNAISANSQRATDLVASGQSGIGLVIDSYAKEQQDHFPFIHFQYQPNSIVLPSYIAALNRKQSDQLGIEFVRFMLSASSQARIEQSPNYKHRRTKIPTIDTATFTVDTGLMEERAVAVQQLFDISISQQQPLLNYAWQLIHKIQLLPGLTPQQTEQLERSVALASTTVISAEQAATEDFLSLQDPVRHPASARTVGLWQEQMSQQLQQSIRLSQDILMSYKQEL